MRPLLQTVACATLAPGNVRANGPMTSRSNGTAAVAPSGAMVGEWPASLVVFPRERGSETGVVELEDDRDGATPWVGAVQERTRRRPLPQAVGRPPLSPGWSRRTMSPRESLPRCRAVR